MNNYSKFNRIRNGVNRGFDSISNVSELVSDSGFKRIHILWLYPDVMNIHGGRGDVMAILHIADLMGLPVEIRRCDNLKQDVDWEWPHMVYMTAGELKCAPDVIAALKRQEEGLRDFISRGGSFIANGSSGAVLADEVESWDGEIYEGLGLLHMDWKLRDSVWGDDICVKIDDELEIIGNQIQVADVKLHEGQEALGTLLYGRGNDGAVADGGSGLEGARSGNVIYTGVLGPLLTKNPRFTASLLATSAEMADIEKYTALRDADIEMEIESAKYIKQFMLDKMSAIDAD